MACGKITEAGNTVSGYLLVKKSIQLNMPLVLVHFTYSKFAWGLHGGVDVKWSGGLIVLKL
jgi:hypothetical protein